MNTEPPTDDDLQQMLVTMRADVAERVSAEPRRRPSRRHWGLTIAFVALLTVGGASGAVALGLVPQPFSASPTAAPSPTATFKPAPATSTPAPDPEPSHSAPPAVTPASIPATCQSAVAADDYSRFFGDMPRDQIRPTASGAEPRLLYIPVGAEFEKNASLVCHWSPSGSTEDITNLYFAVGSATSTELDSYVTRLRDGGYTCDDRLDGRVCQKSSKQSYYGEPIDNTLTFFVRDGTYIDISQSNVPTNGLLDSIVGQIWN